jgi:hypothetical protein
MIRTQDAPPTPATILLRPIGLRISLVAIVGARVTGRARRCKNYDIRAKSSHADFNRRNAATRCNGSPQVDAKFYLSDEGFVPLESV